jgi:sec-independent protein translocase protein TatC
MALLDFFNRRTKGKGESAEMSFIDHLEQLRWHLVRSVIAILVGAIVIFIYSAPIVDKVVFDVWHSLPDGSFFSPGRNALYQ